MKYFIDFYICNKCGKCIEECATDAIIENKDGYLVIDKNKCFGCGICKDRCEIGAIR